MASPLRSLSRGASRGALSLGSAVTPRSLPRAASNHSIRSLNSLGGRRAVKWKEKHVRKT